MPSFLREIKAAISEEPVVVLSDYDKPFEVCTDVSDYAIGGFIMEDRHYRLRELQVE